MKAFVKSIIVVSCAVLWSGLVWAQAPSSTDLPRFFPVIPKQIFRGAQPTPQGIRDLAQMGVKTIVNLRAEDPTTAQAEKNLAQSLGMNYFYEPMDPTGVPNDQEVGYIENTLLSNPQLRPVFVHCHYGEDRTGLIMGLYRVFKQVPNYTPPQAWNEMLQLGFHTSLRNLENYYFQKTNWHPVGLEGPEELLPQDLPNVETGL